MSPTQDQIRAIADECAFETSGRNMDFKAEAIIAAANRIAALREAALKTASATKFAAEFAQAHDWNPEAVQELSIAVSQYAALKVQESGAVEALEDSENSMHANDMPVALQRQAITALRAIIADGTPKNT